MKRISKSFVLCLLMLTGVFSSSLQAQTREEKKIAEVKKLVESRNYLFLAESALPLSGTLFQLTTVYSVKMSKDTIDSHLPYFGVAFRAPYSSTESPLTFISTDFNYSIKEMKKGGFQVKIRINKPDEPDTMFLTISSSGYATLSVNSTFRQSILFYGEIVPPDFLDRKKKSEN